MRLCTRSALIHLKHITDMAYTPIVLPADLKTHVYEGIINEIAENDTTVITTAVSQAIAEAKLYLTRYDLMAIFGDQATDTAATFPPDDLLLNIIKTLSVWNLMTLARPNLDYDAWKSRKDEMKAILKDIQSGKADPRWPYQDYTGVTTPESIEVIAVSNEKANNRY